MTTVLRVGEATAELALLADAVEVYLAGSALSGLSDADVVAELCSLEVVRRRLQAYDNRLVGELDRRGLGASYGARSTKGLLQDLLRVSPGQARRRVDAAQLLGERVSLTGEVLAPVLPATAAAYASGGISAEHVAAVIATVDDLPASLPIEEFERVDEVLAMVAGQCTPRDVATAGVRILDTLGVAGRPPSEEDKQRTRRLMLHRRRDGSYDVTGRLTPDCGAEAEAVLNAFAAPRPAADESGHDTPDERTAAQRLHDALQDVIGLALRADTLPLTGRRAQLIITAHTGPGDAAPQDSSQPPRDARHDEPPADEPPADEPPADEPPADEPPADEPPADEPPADGSPAEGPGIDDSSGDPDEGAAGADRDDAALGGGDASAARRGTLGGIAWTSFGQVISARTAMWLCDTAMLATVILGPNGRVLAYGQTRRFATQAQTRALIARDGGCSFPGCDHPPEWCDAHHITAWTDGGPTDIDNLTLLCGYHHRNFHRIGWQCRIPNGIPEWIPPPHVDPCQTPRRNHRYLLR